MKIGILTLPFNNNYGGLLQSYALQTHLKNQGHEVRVINRWVIISFCTLFQKVKLMIV